jgi:hypothetical protein
MAVGCYLYLVYLSERLGKNAGTLGTQPMLCLHFFVFLIQIDLGKIPVNSKSIWKKYQPVHTN